MHWQDVGNRPDGLVAVNFANFYLKFLIGSLKVFAELKKLINTKRRKGILDSSGCLFLVNLILRKCWISSSGERFLE
ncbi:hypothetical protein BT69DRAFT_892064 [Atractiella rhizophila]|nr:hypothetical protein BT69DRAFT_892064 [Atractiella rhizophila]